MDKFIARCDTFRQERVSSEVVRMTLFSFSLADKATNLWKNKVAPYAFANWNAISMAFVQELFPPSSTQKLIGDLSHLR